MAKVSYTKAIPAAGFGLQLVDEALDEMREMLEKNEAVKALVAGDKK